VSAFWRIVVVAFLGIWAFGTLVPQLSCVWQACPANGLAVNFDGVVTGVDAGSPAAEAPIFPGDRVVAPLPRGLYRLPPQPISLRLNRGGAIRSVTLVPKLLEAAEADRLRLLALCVSYLIFVIVGSAVLLLRPSPMMWAFYLYCVSRRFGDLSFYWPGSSAFYWTNLLAFATLGGAGCALVTIFALRFPNNRLEGWRAPVNAVAIALSILFPLAWLYVFARLGFAGTPSQGYVKALVVLTSLIYLAAAAIFISTLVQSRGDERHRLRWILVFPAVLLLRVAAINIPYSLPTWFSDLLVALGVCVPLTVAYAVVRRRVFDIEFAISRALIYGAITSIVAGIFLLLDWFMSKQFSQTKFTLTAEVVVALALGSWLNMLHHNVDRFVDSTFFRQRHRAEQRLAKAAAAVLRAESHEAVDRFLVHEPVQAFDLATAALFHREETKGQFVRELAVGWTRNDASRLTLDDALVLHLLAEGNAVRIADVRWSSDALPNLGNAVLATPVLLRDELASIVVYGPHRNGADIDPDEVRSLMRLVESAGATYDHIEARTLRARIEKLSRECDAKERELAALRTQRQSSRGAIPGSPSTAT
jgi:hypothetical protein